jgi:hypothetical protein
MTGMLVTARALLSKMHKQFIFATVFAKELATQFMTWMWIFAVIFGIIGCHINYVITIVKSKVVVVKPPLTSLHEMHWQSEKCNK